MMPKAVIVIISVAIISFSLGGFIHHFLDGLRSALPHHFLAQIAVRMPVYLREDKEIAFHEINLYKVGFRGIESGLQTGRALSARTVLGSREDLVR